MQKLFFIVDRSVIAKDEIDAMLRNGSPAELDAVFFLVLDGYSPMELGITGSMLEGPPSVFPAASFAPGLPQIDLEVMPGTAVEDPARLDRKQRITWKYRLLFTGINGFVAQRQELQLSANISREVATSKLCLVIQPHPYKIDGQEAWLSTDLRVFQIKAGQFRFNKVMRSDPNDFIIDVLTNLNNGTTGGETYDNISTSPQSSRLDLSQTVDGEPVYNFAIARVRYKSSSVSAQNVKVFFRLFTTASTTMEYNQATTYRRTVHGGAVKPLLGIIDGEVATIPFFAASRIDYSSAALASQNDQPNTKLIPSNLSGNEIERYFGCWLDVNQPQPQFPISPVPADGPFAASSRKSIQELIRNQSQCLVAEIVFEPVTIPQGATPSTCDKLAQRNLVVAESANPGDSVSDSVTCTFEIRPTRTPPLKEELPDELMIDWGNMPQGGSATLYLPGVDSGEILDMAGKIYKSHTLNRIDEHTLQFGSGGVTYIPVPYSEGANYTAMLSVMLPGTVKKGHVYPVVLRQVTNSVMKGNGQGSLEDENRCQGSGRCILGTFQLTIPVTGKEEMLAREERLLSNLRWIEKSLPAANRWHPVFSRYVQQKAARVDAFGGDSRKIIATPTGQWNKGYTQYRLLGVLAILLIAALLSVTGILEGGTLAFTAVPILLALAWVVSFWIRKSKPPLCQLLMLPLVGGGIGTLTLAVSMITGMNSPQLVALLVLSLLIAIGAGAGGWVKGCFNLNQNRQDK
ncbi:MAG: hypothetical protein HGA70_05925 [Chlorobiaceae bacterium]|nr:hypothetical protein [Chlorobiaceae bacterium]NTW10228.1 hypothetical protein [Chlorobiaceae bacterium]